MVDRREFMKTALGSGFALAVSPVFAQNTLDTPSDGLDAGEMIVQLSDIQLPVYRAQPSGRNNLPVVLIVSEIFGVHQHIADVARRFARAGYLAIAPELFIRQGDPQALGSIQEILDQIISKVPDQQVMADLDACLDWAATQGGDLSRVAVTGFCWGGRISWLYAAQSTRVRSAVAWYGRLVGAQSVNTPRHPIDSVDGLKAPVLGLYGGQDSGIPLETVEQMKGVLAASSNVLARASQFRVYADAPHAFFADYRPSYREMDARDAWQRCLAWFAQHGVI
jgi:carboxymethylenebutenolidase